MLIQDLLNGVAESHPYKLAIKHCASAMTYGELNRVTDRLAAELRALNLGRSHIGIMIENSTAYVVAYFSITKAGAVIVPINSSLPPERLKHEIEYCDLDSLITAPDRTELLTSALRHASRLKRIFALQFQQGTGQYELALAAGIEVTGTSRCVNNSSETDTAVMLSTSGSAARPRRVMLSHRNLIENVRSFLDVARLQETDRALIALPLTASGTNTTELLSYVSQGLSITIYPHQVFLVSEYCKLLHEDAITVVNVTPMILNLMLRESVKVGQKITRLRKAFFASTPMPARRLEQVAKRFPHVQLYYGYGLTEAGPRCTTLLPEFLHLKPGSCGRPLKNVEIRIVDDLRQPVASGQVGEIAVKGPNVMLGYYKQPRDTDAIDEGGWLYTGDLGSVDDDGFLFVRGRKKSVIVTRGLNVCPEEVEQALLEHDAVYDAFVVGVSDDLISERVVAYVVAREGDSVTEAQLRSFLSRRIERIKIPSSIFFVPELRRNSNHKLVRYEAAASGLDPQPKTQTKIRRTTMQPVLSHPKNVVKYFDVFRQRYFHYDNFVRMFNNLFPSGHHGKSVLDLGCGTGTFAFFMADAGYNVMGIDASDESIEIAKRRAGNRAEARFYVQNFHEPRLNDEKFDLITHLHIPTSMDDIRTTVAKYRNHLKEDGFIAHLHLRKSSNVINDDKVEIDQHADPEGNFKLVRLNQWLIEDRTLNVFFVMFIEEGGGMRMEIDRYRMELLHKGEPLEHEFYTEVSDIPSNNFDSAPPWTEEFLQVLTHKRA
ncbi:MAG TPA: AMP-binding protein [Blastocatellia bacterium]|jgi:long-chain acyl-CoA synthetase